MSFIEIQTVRTAIDNNYTLFYRKCLLLKKKKALYLSVNVFSTKVLTVDTIFTTGPPFYVVIRATRRSSRLKDKGSTFISQLFKDPEYWSGPGNRARDLPLCSQALYRLS